MTGVKPTQLRSLPALVTVHYGRAMSTHLGAALPPRADAIRDFRSAGGKVAAVFPIHYPRALLRAHGLLPVEVWGPPGIDTGLGDAHLQAYTCGVVRASLSFILSPASAFADLFVVPHACDSTQGLASVLLDFLKPQRPVLPMYLPRGEGGAAIIYLADELRRLGQRLSQVTGTSPEPEELSACIAREEHADGRLRELFERRRELPLSDSSFYQLVRSREYLPAERFAEVAAGALADTGVASSSGVPILLSGILPEPMELFDVLTQMGASVAGDDLACTGRRLYPPGVSTEPYLRMAESLLGGPPDSTRGASIEARAQHLKNLARRTSAKAVVFFGVKFCEPEQFYLPQLRAALDPIGVRTLSVEVNPGERLPDQVITRLEALMETVR